MSTAEPVGSCLFVIAVLFSTDPSAVADSAGGGGPMPENRENSCIPPWERDDASRQAAAFEALQELNNGVTSEGEPPRLTFYPLAGTLSGDLFLFNYVDVNPANGVPQDWDCTDHTYDGHSGNDTDLRSFAEQAIGVPVFAALDGTVVAAHDGEPDMNTVWNNQPSNYVILNHGGGRRGWYWHLKNGSVVVSPGEVVSAGQQIGLAASSGISAGPHLHFEVQDNHVVVEPFAGDCRPGDSLWVRQPPFDRSAYLHDFGLTHQNLFSVGPWPAAWPTTGQIALTDPWTRVWWYGTALPPYSYWQVKFIRPNGLTHAQPVQGFANPVYWRWYNWWWSYDVPALHSVTGTWRVQLFINGTLAIDAPFEVRPQRTADFNRPPEPITAAFDPPIPVTGDVLICRVNTSLTVDDPDFDHLRYTYVWTVDGVEARRVTSAAHGDVLARSWITAGAVVECRVTPNDGRVDGPGGGVSVQVVEPWGVDCNRNTIDDAADLAGGMSDDANRDGTLDECNINCANALPAGLGPTIGRNDWNDDMDIEASCSIGDARDVWFSFLADCAGEHVVTTKGSSLSPLNDAVLSIWSGCDGGEIACDDDGGGSRSRVAFQTAIGETYFIRIAGAQGAAGAFVLNVSAEARCLHLQPFDSADRTEP